MLRKVGWKKPAAFAILINLDMPVKEEEAHYKIEIHRF